MSVAGADIGGTFTDIVLVTESGELRVEKRLSTREDYAVAVGRGFALNVRPGRRTGTGCRVRVPVQQWDQELGQNRRQRDRNTHGTARARPAWRP